MKTLLLLLSLLAMNAVAAPKTRLLVAAASSIKPALEPLVTKFMEQHADVEVKVTYGATGILVGQVLQGAPFHLLLGADSLPKLTKVDKVQYAAGRLVLWVPSASKLDLAKGLALVAEPSVKKVAISNPETAPYGVAAVQALEKSGLLDACKPKFVKGQSAAQSAQFAASGNAEMALLPRALAAQLGEQGRWVLVDDALHAPITHLGAVLKPTPAAKALMELLLSDVGRAAFEVL